MSQVTSAGLMLTPAATAKTAKAVNQVLSNTGNRSDQMPGVPMVYQPFWAKLTGANSATTGPGCNGSSYSWSQLQLSGGILSAPSMGASDSKFSAFEANLSPGIPAGTCVRMEFAGFNASNNSTYIFSARAPHTLWVVNVTLNPTPQTANQGSAGTLCSYTYDVSTLDGLLIAKMLTVEKPRLFGMTESAATLGVAYMDAANPPKVHLWDVGETAASVLCNTS